MICHLIWSLFIVAAISVPHIWANVHGNLILTPSEVNEGGKVKGMCTTLGGRGSFRFRWERDGQLLRDDFNTKIVNMEDMSIMSIDSVSRQHQGNYTCFFDTTNGGNKATSRLLVNVPPRWLIKPRDEVTLSMGSSSTVDCLGDSSPPPKTTWKRKDNLPFSSWVTVNSNGSLTFSQGRKEIEGEYICSVSNGLGLELTGSSKVRVLVPVKLLEGEEKFSVQKVKKGESSAIRCSGIGDHPISVLWTKDKQSMDLKENRRIELYETKTDRGITSEMNIRVTDRSDNGQYTCTVKNDYGQEEKTTKILVIEVPESVQDVRVTEVWSKSVAVTWSPPFTGNSPISSYLIHYWNKATHSGSSGQNSLLLEERASGSATSAMIKNLHPGTVYLMTVTAVNDVGVGVRSHSVSFVTGEEAPSSPPLDLTIHKVFSNGVKLSWRPPPKGGWNGNLTGYYIQYRPIHSAQPYIKTVNAFNSHNVTYTYHLTGLNPSSNYRISVKGYNNAGTGEATEELDVHTLASDPPHSPSLAGFNLISKTMVKIHWRSSIIGETTPISGYIIYCKETRSNIFTNIIPVSKHHHSYTIANLQPGVSYSFYVTSFNPNGESEWSEPLDVEMQDSSFGFMMLLAESNMLLVSALLISFVTILLAILASVIYVKRAKVQHDEVIRQYATLARPMQPRYSEKCGTSSSTYATIPADQIGAMMPGGGHVMIRPTDGSEASYEYGPNDAAPMHTLKPDGGNNKSKDYEEIIYDEALN